MNPLTKLHVIVLHSLGLIVCQCVTETRTKPHVILILADDYGHGNLGYHRRGAQTPDEKQAVAEVHTPTLDGLIDTGIYLERHYSYKICSPSRSSLQSGRLAVHVNTKNAGVTSRTQMTQCLVTLAFHAT